MEGWAASLCRFGVIFLGRCCRGREATTSDNIPLFQQMVSSLFYGMGGVRMRVSNHTRFQPFGQALFGGVHGFGGYFPRRL